MKKKKKITFEDQHETVIIIRLQYSETVKSADRWDMLTHATIPNQIRTQTKNKNILVPSMDNSDDMYQCLDVHKDNQSVFNYQSADRTR